MSKKNLTLPSINTLYSTSDDFLRDFHSKSRTHQPPFELSLHASYSTKLGRSAYYTHTDAYRKTKGGNAIRTCYFSVNLVNLFDPSKHPSKPFKIVRAQYNHDATCNLIHPNSQNSIRPRRRGRMAKDVSEGSSEEDDDGEGDDDDDGEGDDDDDGEEDQDQMEEEEEDEYYGPNEEEMMGSSDEEEAEEHDELSSKKILRSRRPKQQQQPQRTSTTTAADPSQAIPSTYELLHLPELNKKYSTLESFQAKFEKRARKRLSGSGGGGHGGYYGEWEIPKRRINSKGKGLEIQWVVKKSIDDTQPGCKYAYATHKAATVDSQRICYWSVGLRSRPLKPGGKPPKKRWQLHRTNYAHNPNCPLFKFAQAAEKDEDVQAQKTRNVSESGSEMDQDDDGNVDDGDGDEVMEEGEKEAPISSSSHERKKRKGTNVLATPEPPPKRSRLSRNVNNNNPAKKKKTTRATTFESTSTSTNNQNHNQTTSLSNFLLTINPTLRHHTPLLTSTSSQALSPPLSLPISESHASTLIMLPDPDLVRLINAVRPKLGFLLAAQLLKGVRVARMRGRWGENLETLRLVADADANEGLGKKKNSRIVSTAKPVGQREWDGGLEGYETGLEAVGRAGEILKGLEVHGRNR